MMTWARFVSLSLLVCVGLFAQATGRLTGVIQDASGAKVPGATVSLYLSGGNAPLLTAKTSSEGVFDFVTLRPALYDVHVEAAGFAKSVSGGIKVDPARETALPAISLQVASASQTIEVSESPLAVQTTNFEVATTVTQKQVEQLPILDRQIGNLFSLQAGVGSNNLTATVINGLRPSYSALTLDGINVQDNWVRTNGLDFLPNRLTIGQVAEMTVSTSNSNASLGGGANQISMVTPSGTNAIHGSLYWFNRNNAAAANDWFNNQTGVEKPRLNLNQFGGTVGGPIKKDKLFYYANYESYRRRSQTPILNTVLTPTARQGILRYRLADGSVQSFNVLTTRQVTPSPLVARLLQDVPVNGNSNQAGDGLNTIGYNFNARSNIDRDFITGKGDYYLNAKNSFSSSYIWNRDRVDRPTLGTFYTVTPPTINDNSAHFWTVAWRSTLSASLTNELRGGFNRTKSPFVTSNPVPDLLLAGLLYTSPLNTKLPEGRDTSTYVIQDNANWIRGKHSLSFGYQGQYVRVPVYDYAGTVPTYTLGISGANPIGFAAGEIPGLPANFLNTANNLLANLGGIISSGARTFNPQNATSGFVAGAPLTQNWRQNNHAFYVTDSWRLRPRLTLILGMRYDYWGVPDEKESLQLQPVVQNGDGFGTLLTNATLNLHGYSVGRPLYQRDKNNWAPNIGFAWDVFGDGKTSLRGGYSIGYASDNNGNSIFNTTNANFGLSSAVSFLQSSATLSAPPPLNAPPFRIPLSVRDAFVATGGNNTLGLIDPRLATPYVQQYNLSLQREFKGYVFEGRYVGNHSVGTLRQVDANQINPFQSGFAEDAIRARNNGFAAQRAGLGFNPAYNANVPGSQPLPVLSTFTAGGNLNNPTVRNQLLTGEIGSLSQTYQQTLPSLGAINSFFPNPNALFAGYLTNVSHSSYNAAQFEVRRAFRSGYQFQANYTFSKVLSDATALRALDAALDNRNLRLERSRAPWDTTHAFKLNHVWALPFGPGHRLTWKPINRLIGGWSLTGFLTVQSGSPISIFSARGTFNRGARSGNNTVDTNLSGAQLRRDVVGFYMTGDGPYFINPRHIGPDGRGVASDGAAPFDGQVFFNPQPGTFGGLQRRFFSGPWFRNYDFSILKDVAITERQKLQIRAEFFNLTNTASFQHGATTGSANQNVNSATFGRIVELASTSRQIQFSLFYRF